MAASLKIMASTGTQVGGPGQLFTLNSSEALQFRFRVEITANGPGSLHQLRVDRYGIQDTRSLHGLCHSLDINEHDSCLDFFASVAMQFGTRMPLNRMPVPARTGNVPYT